MVLINWINDEKNSSVRYLANLEIRFKVDLVRSLLVDFDIPFSETTDLMINYGASSLLNKDLDSPFYKSEQTAIKEQKDDKVYLLRSFKEDKGINLYSKKYSCKKNPTKHFIAIMTCSDADQMCPVIKGADKKISLSYLDPRVADNTGLEKEVYNQTCSIIAKEMFYLMKQVKKIV